MNDLECIASLEVIALRSILVPVPANSSDLENPISLSNTLLIAAPCIDDGMFNHSVIMLTQHSSENGAHGIIINHPAKITVEHLLPQFLDTPLGKLEVFHGGPVAMDKLAFTAISYTQEKGLKCQFSIDTDTAMDLVETDHLVCPTVGHSAWESGQLESELQRNSWITSKATAFIFEASWNLALWENYLHHLSPYHSLIARAPKNPALN